MPKVQCKEPLLLKKKHPLSPTFLAVKEKEEGAEGKVYQKQRPLANMSE